MAPTSVQAQDDALRRHMARRPRVLHLTRGQYVHILRTVANGEAAESDQSTR